MLVTSALTTAGVAQTITYTTTGTLSVITGSDKLGLNNTSFTVINTLTQGQSPLTGTQNQYSTTITSVSDPDAGFSTSNVAGTITINYVGPNNAANSIALSTSVKEIITLNVNSTVLVPSITGVSPGPITSTPLGAGDTLTISDGSSSTTYGFANGSISSVPAQSGCTFTVAPTSLNFPIGGGSTSLVITPGVGSSSCPWTASANQGFIQLGTTSGTGSGTVLVTVPANTTQGSLSGTITVAGQSIPVVQAGPITCTFSVFPTTLSFDSGGGSTTVNVTASSANCAWTATSNASFLSVGTSSGTGNGTVLVTALSNTTGGTLNGFVTIAGQSVAVTESGTVSCIFTVSPLSGSFPLGGGTVTLGVTPSDPSCSWTATSNQDWATLSESSGTGTGSVVVTATPNSGTASRSAIVTIAGQQVPLIEAGSSTICSFAVAPTTLNIPGTVSEFYMGVAASASSCTWNASLIPSFFTLNVTKGTGNGSVMVIASANPSTSIRTANFTLAGVTIPVSQLGSSGCTFTVSPATLNFPYTGSTENVTITTPSQTCTWTASSNQSWTIVSPTSGTGNGTVSVTAAPNTSTSTLTGSISVANQLITVTEIGVTGCVYTVSPLSVAFPGNGGTSLLTITTSFPTCSWTATSAAPWITLTPNTGTGSGTVLVNAAGNTTTVALNATATVAGQTVNLTEASGSACSFTVSPGSLLFPSTGGSLTETVTASSSSCPWTASSNSPLITVSPLSGTGTGPVTVTVGNNANGSTQSGTIVVAGQTITVAESGGCSFTVSPSSIAVDTNGGTQTLTISGGAPSCSWSAASTVPWATLNTASGIGPGSVTVTIPAAVLTADQAGTLNVAGQSISVLQDFTAQVFNDVPPSAYYFDAVNILSTKGVTAGCGNNDFCPGETLTRADMAIFIVRAIFGSDNFSYNPTPIFNDVGVNDFGFAWIQELSQLGITGGCGNNDFCPNDVVTRDQMAVFLVRGRLGSTTVFTYPGNPYFSDVPSTYSFFPWIQRLAYDQITSGCGNGMYCPTESISRGDTSILLVRSLFNQLLLPGTPLITQLSPNTLNPGEGNTITITGVNTNFVQGTTYLSPIPGITIGTLTVVSPTVLTVALAAADNAAIQPNSVLVITGNEQAVLPSGLIVQ